MNFLRRVVPVVSRRFLSSSSSAPKPRNGNGLWAKYLGLLETNPITTKAVTSGVLTFGADLICQLVFPDDAHIAKIKSLKEGIEKEEKAPKFGLIDEFQLRADMIDWKRTAIFTTIGTFYIGPILHYWYGYLMTAFAGRWICRGYVVCLNGYSPVMLLPYSISSGALESPDHLPSCSTISLAVQNTVIPIITHQSIPTPKSPLNQYRYWHDCHSQAVVFRPSNLRSCPNRWHICKWLLTWRPTWTHTREINEGLGKIVLYPFFLPFFLLFVSLLSPNIHNCEILWKLLLVLMLIIVPTLT